jgi:hypothetical protein
MTIVRLLYSLIELNSAVIWDGARLNPSRCRSPTFPGERVVLDQKLTQRSQLAVSDLT